MKRALLFSLAGEGVEAVSLGHLSLLGREGGARGLEFAEAAGGVASVRRGNGFLHLAHALGLGVGLSGARVRNVMKAFALESVR